jgi:integrase
MAHVERRRRNGQSAWRARYRAPDGRERSKTFRRRADAERFLTTVEASKLRGDWIDPVRGRITYREWSERYFAHALHKRPTTLARDHCVNEKHLLPALGEQRLASLTPLETLSAGSVRTDYAVLRAILNAAVEAEILAVSPCRGVRLPPQRRYLPRFLSADELQRLADATPAEYRPMIYLAGVLGLRWSEIAGLRVGRLDFLRGTLAVVETCAEVEGRVMFADVKTAASRRTLALPPFLVELLAAHLAARGRPGPEELVFVAPEGGPLRRTLFRTRVFDPAKRAAGLDDSVTFHGLRHSAVGADDRGRRAHRGDQAAPRPLVDPHDVGRLRVAVARRRRCRHRPAERAVRVPPHSGGSAEREGTASGGQVSSSTIRSASAVAPRSR